MIRIPWLVLLLISCESPGSSLSATRDTKPFFLELEGGPLWQSRNDVRNPGSTGTEFSMVDGLAAPQGRAFDLSIKSHYDLWDWCSLGFGYRAIEGGVDNDEVYNFAWFQSLVVSLGLRF